MLITPADHWFSLCVRTRTDWTCERCGKKYEEGSQGLHCSHYFGRGHWSVRFDPLNAFAHCYGCHMQFEGNPDYFVSWVIVRLGDEQIDILRDRENDPSGRGKEIKRTKGKGEIAAHFKAEYERMLQERSRGVTGRIEFSGWTD